MRRSSTILPGRILVADEHQKNHCHDPGIVAVLGLMSRYLSAGSSGSCHTIGSEAVRYGCTSRTNEKLKQMLAK
jgi:hypothetical protein